VNKDFDLHRFLYRETGSFYLKKTVKEGIWKVDLSHYYGYKVRDLYEKYGGKVILDENQIISVEYEDNVLTSDVDGYARAIQIFKATLSVDLIMKSHLVLCHMATSQDTYFDAACTRYNRLTDAEKEFFAITTFHTNAINASIPVLAGPYGSLVHRAFAFDQKELQRAMNETYNELKSMSSEEMKDWVLGQNGTAWNDAVTPYYNRVEKLIRDYFKGDNISEHKVRKYTNFLFIITASHEAFGDSQLGYMVFCDIPCQVHKKDHTLITEDYINIIMTMGITVGTRIVKLVRIDDYITVIKDENRKKTWIDFVKDCSYNISSLGNLSWLNFDNFEISVGY